MIINNSILTTLSSSIVSHADLCGKATTTSVLTQRKHIGDDMKQMLWANVLRAHTSACKFNWFEHTKIEIFLRCWFG